MRDPVETHRSCSDFELPLPAMGADPGLLLAWAPPGASPLDRAPVGPAEGLVIGRDPAGGWAIADARLSKQHAHFFLDDGVVWVADLGSTNGTYVAGVRIEAPQALRPSQVVRCGSCLFVVTEQLRSHRAAPDPPPPEGLVGPFHAAALLEQLEETARLGRHVLFVGDSGVGKEIAAKILARRLGELGTTSGKLVSHNCARMTSAEEGVATLFGVGARVFSEVGARRGLLEQADGGLLFLDELHELPARVQRALLRFVEDGLVQRIGDEQARSVQVLVAGGTNLPLEQVRRDDLIAFDLLSRLHVVAIPDLNARRADVPAIFRHHVATAAVRAGVPKDLALAGVRTAHIETLLVHDFRGRNVRELIQVAERYVARLARLAGPAEPSRAPQLVLSELLVERYPDNPVVQRVAAARAGTESPSPEPSGESHYERNRARILAAYYAAGQNLSATERALKESGLSVSRRWLAEYLRRWGVR